MRNKYNKIQNFGIRRILNKKNNKMEGCPKIPMLSFELKMCNYEITDFTEKICKVNN